MVTNFSRFIRPYIIKPDLPLPSSLPPNQPVDYTPPDETPTMNFGDSNLGTPPPPPTTSYEPPPPEYTEQRPADADLYGYINSIRAKEQAPSSIPVERELMQRAEVPHVPTRHPLNRIAPPANPFRGAVTSASAGQRGVIAPGATVSSDEDQGQRIPSPSMQAANMAAAKAPSAPIVIPRGGDTYALPNIQGYAQRTFPGAPATSSFLLERGAQAVPPPPQLTQQQIQQRMVQKAKNIDEVFFALGGTSNELQNYKTTYGEHPFGLLKVATKENYPYLLSALKSKVQNRLNAMRAREAEAAGTVTITPFEQQLMAGGGDLPISAPPFEIPTEKTETPQDLESAKAIAEYGAEAVKTATGGNVTLGDYVPTESQKRGDIFSPANVGRVTGMVLNLMGLKALTPAAISQLGPTVSNAVLFGMQGALDNPDPTGKMSFEENATARATNALKGAGKGAVIGKLMGAAPSVPREQLSMIAPGAAATVGKGIVEGKSPEQIAAEVSSEDLPLAIFPAVGRIFHGEVPKEATELPPPTTRVEPAPQEAIPAVPAELPPSTLKGSDPNSATATIARQARLYDEMKDMTFVERDRMKARINLRVGTSDELPLDRAMLESARRVDDDISRFKTVTFISNQSMPTTEEYMQELKNVYAPEAEFRPPEEARTVAPEAATADFGLPPASVKTKPAEATSFLTEISPPEPLTSRRWLTQENERMANLAEKAGLGDRIEELSARGLTVREIAKELDPELSKLVDPNDPYSAVEKREIVRGVKNARDIPSIGQPIAYQTWLNSRSQPPIQPLEPLPPPSVPQEQVAVPAIPEDVQPIQPTEPQPEPLPEPELPPPSVDVKRGYEGELLPQDEEEQRQTPEEFKAQLKADAQAAETPVTEPPILAPARVEKGYEETTQPPKYGVQGAYPFRRPYYGTELPPSEAPKEAAPPTPEELPPPTTPPVPVETPPIAEAPKSTADKLRSIADRLEQEARDALRGGPTPGALGSPTEIVAAAKLVAANLLRGGASIADIISNIRAQFGHKFDEEDIQEIQRQGEAMAASYHDEAPTEPTPSTELPPPTQKPRQTVESAKPYFDKGIESEFYQELTNPESIDTSEALIRSDPEQARRLAMNEEATNEEAPLSNALSIGLINKAQGEAREAEAAGNTDLAESKRQEATELIRAAAERSTRFGQEIQFLALLNRVSPEGARLYAESQVQKAARKVVEKKPDLPQQAKQEAAVVNQSLGNAKTEAAAEAAQEVAARVTGESTRRSSIEKARAVREQNLAERKVKYDAKVAEWETRAQAAINRIKSAFTGVRMEAGGGQFLFDVGDVIVSKMMAKGLRKYGAIRNDVEAAIGQKMDDREYNKAAIEARKKYTEEMKALGMPDSVIADPAKIVAARLRAKEAGAKEANPIDELINNVVSLANERLLPKARSAKGYLDVLRQAAENRPEATQLWEEAKTAAREKFKDDPEALKRIEPFLNSDPGKLISDGEFNKALNEFVKGRGDDIADIVRNTLGKGDATRDDLIKALTENKNLSASEAEDIADLARSQYDQMLREKQVKIAEGVTKTRVSTPVVEKSLAERKAEINNLTGLTPEEKTKAITAIERKEADSLVRDKPGTTRAPLTKEEKIAQINQMETLSEADKKGYADKLETKEQTGLLRQMLKEPTDVESGPSKTLQDKINLVSSLDKIPPNERADAVAALERREFERLVKEPPAKGEAKPDPTSKIDRINNLKTISPAEKQNATTLLKARQQGQEERGFLNRILKDSKRGASKPLTLEQKTALVESIQNATDAEKSTAIAKLKSDALQRMIAERPTAPRPQKSMADKILDIQGAGGFTEAQRSSETARLIAKKMGIPTLDGDTAREIDKMASDINGMTDKDERDIATSLMMMKIGEQLPEAGYREKAQEFIRLGKLLGPDTMNRFFVRHIGFAGVEAALETPHAAIDKAISLVTGKRTQFVPDYKQMATDAIVGFGKAAENAARYGIRPGQTGATEVIKQPAMRGRIAEGMRRIHDVVIASAPVGVYKSFYEQQLRNIKRGAGLGEADLPTREMTIEAKRRGLEAAMQDKNFANEVLSGIRKAGNKLGSYLGGVPLGDALVLYSQAPGSAFVRSLEYSPGGIVRAAYELGLRPTVKGEPFRQYDFGRVLTRGLFGTAALMSLGIVGGASGLITDPVNDPRARRLQEKLGIKGHAFNISGMLRKATGGSADLQDGDHLVGYDWIEPFASPINLGLNVLKAGQRGDGQAGSVVSAFLKPSAWLEGTEKTITEEPLVAGLSQKFGVAREGGLKEAAKSLFSDMPSLFIPSLFTQLRTDIDKTPRDTYDPNFFQETLNKTLNNLPWLSETLPGGQGPFGEEKEKVGKFSTYQKSPEAEYGLGLYSKLEPDRISDKGAVSYLPPSAPRTIILNKPDGSQEKVDIKPEQRREYQTFVGGATERLYKLADNSTFFKSLPANEQARLLSNYIENIKKRGDIVVLGQRYENQDEILKDTVVKDPAIFDHNAKVDLAHSDAEEFAKAQPDYRALSPDNQKKVKEQIKNNYVNYKIKENPEASRDELHTDTKDAGNELDAYKRQAEPGTKTLQWQSDVNAVIKDYRQAQNPELETYTPEQSKENQSYYAQPSLPGYAGARK